MRKMASETVHPETGMLNNAMSQISLVQGKYILYKNYFEMIEIVKFNFVNGFSYRESKQTVCLVIGCVSTYMGTINRDPLSCMQDNRSRLR